MSSNTAICSVCGLLRKDFWLDKQGKPVPICLSCVERAKNSPSKTNKKGQLDQHHHGGGGGCWANNESIEVYYHHENDYDRPPPALAGSSSSSSSLCNNGRVEDSTKERAPDNSKNNNDSSKNNNNSSSKNNNNSSSKNSNSNTVGRKQKLTCTRCGLIRHAVYFDEDEHEKQAPCCRNCRTKGGLARARLNSLTATRGAGNGAVLSKRQLRINSQKQSMQRQQNEIASPREVVVPDEEPPPVLQPKTEEIQSDFNDDIPSEDDQCQEEQGQNQDNDSSDEDSDDDDNDSSLEEKKTPDIPKETETQVESDCEETIQLYKNLVEALLQPGREWGVAEDLRFRPTLYKYVRNVLDVYNPKLSWLTWPLVEGLTAGDNKINQRVCFPHDQHNTPVLYSLLAWTCHAKYLEQACGWQGGDIIVPMVLSVPSININDVFFDKTNAAFFAVVYNNPKTLQYLIQAGLDVYQQRDLDHHSILYHALNNPQPDMIRLVFNHVNVNFWKKDADGVRAAPHLMQIGALVTSKQGTAPSCWRRLGKPPELADIAESLIVVRQRGAPLRPNNETRVALDTLSKFAANELMESLMGLWIPAKIQERLNVRCKDVGDPQMGGEMVELCQVHELDTTRPVTTLHCGHLLCHECVVGYNQKNKGRSLCPVCSRRLGKDVIQAYNLDEEQRAQKQSLRANLEHEQLHSLYILTESQVIEETGCQGLWSISNYLLGAWSLREKLLNQVLQGHLQPAPQVGGMDSILDLQATHTHILMDGRNNTVVTAPQQGPVCIEIWIRGVPVLAHVSNQNYWTLVSSAVAQNFHLARTDGLGARGIVLDINGKPTPKAPCLRAFSFTLHGNKSASNANNNIRTNRRITSPSEVDVTLHNAIEVPTLCGMGVLLGLDFFLSAAYCVADLQVTVERGQSASTMRCDGLFSWIVPNAAKANKQQQQEPAEESLRYYARNGSMVRLPVFHFHTRRGTNQQLDEEMIQMPTLQRHNNIATKFQECRWCCRTCTDGMMHCQTCADQTGVLMLYCDERCQAAASLVHAPQCGQKKTSAVVAVR